MKQREGPLDLDKNQGKTMIVNNPGGKGAGQPGFFCEVCNRTCKDSVGYLDHINGRTRMLLLITFPSSPLCLLPWPQQIYDGWAKLRA